MARKRIAAVHGCAVVPHDDVADGPTMFVDQIWLGHVWQQFREQRLAVGFVQAFNLGGVAGL